MSQRIATAFEFQLLASGDVLVEFFGGDGKTLSIQIIAGKVFNHLPILAYIAQVAVGQGAEAAAKMMDELVRRA
jgi:hypothetical protein